MKTVIAVLSLSLLSAWALPGPVHAQDRVAWRGAEIHTAAGETFEPGTLVVENGKIRAVGPVNDTPIPDGFQIVDVWGRVIIPGLVDSHSHLGVYSRPRAPANSDGNEMTGPVQSMVRALDAVNARDPGIRMANAGGVTTANIMPGSGNVIGGQTVYVKLRGETIEQMLVEPSGVLGGLKMANGENPKRSYGSNGKAPGTRMKVAALQRSAFVKAQDYLHQWREYREQNEAGEDAAPPDRDLSLEPLVEVLEKRRTVHFHTHRADDILTVLRLRKEFDFELVIQHGTEAYKVLDEIARHQVPVSMTVLDSPGGKAEVVDFIEECGAQLARRGIPVLVNTDDPITESRFFLRTAAIPVRGGLPEDLALQSITILPARAMHLDHRIGSLEAEKDADFVILSGPPFSIYTRVLQTFIDGQSVFHLQDAQERTYQTGGFAVADASQIPDRAPLLQPRTAVETPEPPAGNADVDGKTTSFVVHAGRLHPVSGPVIEDGAVWVRDGQIAFVGPRGQLNSPAGTPVVVAAEVTPGLIDAHSVVPLAGEYNIAADQDANEESDPNQADVRVLDAFNPQEPLLRFLLEQGITVVHACPGRANVIGGLSGVFRTHGTTAEGMTLKFPHAMLFSLGATPKETYSERRPGTRMGTAALIREALVAADNYGRRLREAAEDDESATDTPERDLKLEALHRVLQREIPAVFCAQRADDLQTALRLAREFGLQAQLALAAEAYLIHEEILTAGVPVIVHPTMQRVGDLETYNSFLGNAGALADSGIRVAIGSGVESYVPKTRVVRHEAAMAMVYGLGFERALQAITLDAARILGISETHGSLDIGKAADLVLYDGDPFEHATHVTHVVVSGRLVVDRANRPPLPVAVRQMLPTPEIPCCVGW